MFGGCLASASPHQIIAHALQVAVAPLEPCLAQSPWPPLLALVHIPLRRVQPDGPSLPPWDEFETKYFHQPGFLQTKLPRLFSF